MRYWILLITLFCLTSSVFAGEAENITACVKKAKEFAGVSLDPFNVKYEGNYVAFSIARWPEAYCEVKVPYVDACNIILFVRRQRNVFMSEYINLIIRILYWTGVLVIVRVI